MPKHDKTQDKIVCFNHRRPDLYMFDWLQCHPTLCRIFASHTFYPLHLSGKGDETKTEQCCNSAMLVHLLYMILRTKLIWSFLVEHGIKIQKHEGM